MILAGGLHDLPESGKQFCPNESFGRLEFRPEQKNTDGVKAESVHGLEIPAPFVQIEIFPASHAGGGGPIVEPNRPNRPALVAKVAIEECGICDVHEAWKNVDGRSSSFLDSAESQ